MRSYSRILFEVFLSLMIFSGFSQALSADQLNQNDQSTQALTGGGDDSNSDLNSGFLKTMTNSHAILIRVPVNENGEENTNFSEMRVYEGSTPIADPAALPSTWLTSRDVKNLPGSPQVLNNQDSSTFHRSHWNGLGWVNPYWYSYYYYPTFYYNNLAYNYGYPYYYNVYSPYSYRGYPYWGYRYYYYPSIW